MKMCSKEIIQEEKNPSFKLINLNESAKCQVCATEVEKHIVDFNINKHQRLLCYFCGILADVKVIERKIARVKQYILEHMQHTDLIREDCD
jgi:hypothetical protein